ncbi:MAG: M48 family metallopeptidase [Chloroflexota bacterium]|nr:M48 family metallopeptidase [Chloroflexota bacterium]
MKTQIIRSKRRRKTVSAREVDGIFVVRAPADMSDEELAPIIEKLQAQWDRRRRRNALDDDQLEQRARDLNRRCFDGKLRWQSIRWVSNQLARFGSCTPNRGTIRISHRVAEMPRFVQDYVLVHELAHLAEPNHGPRFWELVYRYPRTERARGYLMAVGMEELEDD